MERLVVQLLLLILNKNGHASRFDCSTVFDCRGGVLNFAPFFFYPVTWFSTVFSEQREAENECETLSCRY